MEALDELSQRTFKKVRAGKKTDAHVSGRVGLLGELEVELQLVKKGWHPVRLDTAQMASNADLLAVNRRHRVALQVKTTDADKQHRHSEWLGFGYANASIRNGNPIFNSKNSPLVADVVVAVSYRTCGSKFVVMPVALAEALCRLHCDYWWGVPTNTVKGTRSDTFPIYLCFSAQRKPHAEHHDRIKRNVAAFVDRWDILFEPIEKLRVTCTPGRC